MTAEKRIGLVLGGGGARGLAHIGVLEGLERLGLAPVCVVGVSMGAVVGGVYALREDWSPTLREEDWRRLPVVSEVRDGDLLERLTSYARGVRRLAPTVSHWRPSGGFTEDARAVLVDLVGDPTARVEDCRVPFAAVTTDLRGGQRVPLGEGPLVEAMLASASIPGLARPVERDGRALVDGGFVDPAPVDLARALGAERVVGVHVGLPPEGSEPAEGWGQALLRAFEAGQRSFAAARFRHADLVLRPAFGARTRMLDFSAVADLVAMGAAAVEDEREALEALASG